MLGSRQIRASVAALNAADPGERRAGLLWNDENAPTLGDVENPLAFQPIEVALLLSLLLTLGLWALLLWGVSRRSWPLAPTVVLGLFAAVPLVGPVIGAATLFVTARRGSRARTLA